MYPKSNDKYLYKKRERYKQTQRGGQWEDRGRDGSDSSTSQERQRLPQAPTSRGGAWTRFSSEPLAETNLANSLMFNFWPPERCENQFLLFEATEFVVICYNRTALEN